MYLMIEAAAAAIVLIPPFFLLSRFMFHNRNRAVLCYLFAVYLAGVYHVTGLPNVTYIRLDAAVNLIPFRDMLEWLGGTLLNVVMFLPLGFFLPLLWKPFYSLRKTILFGFFLSLSIEVLQLFTFRASDINDLITNTLGAFLGWMPGCLAVRFMPALPGTNARKELTAVLGGTVLVMFFVYPFFLSLVQVFLL